ncbi:MAG: PH domain-containing protein [Planctomycetales bacterium]|nr:PH domain-containing protein [Planctomycetales bacterium]
MFVPEQALLRASQWCYRGVWSLITRWLKVPELPPALLGAEDRDIRRFRPAQGFLRYQKLFFWIGLTIFDGALFIAWIVLLLAAPWIGIILTPIIWAIMILPDIVAYIAIHVRYDTTWYVLSDRSLWIRRGIWTIHETTITYDNIQNVSIQQGPVQRHFGISNVIVETAGGGMVASPHGQSTNNGHVGLLEGIDNAAEVRELILEKWQQSRTDGLGNLTADQDELPMELAGGFSLQQVGLLQEIHQLAQTLAKH